MRFVYQPGIGDLGGHEPSGSTAGDGIWGVRIWAGNLIGQTYEYGMNRGSVDDSDGQWI